MPDTETIEAPAGVEAPPISGTPHEVAPEWMPPPKDPAATSDDAPQDAFNKMLDSIPGADVPDADTKTELKPDGVAPETAGAAESDTAGAEDPFAGLIDLEPDVRKFMGEKFLEFLKSNGAEVAPIQPDPAVAAKVEAAAPAQAQQPPVSPFGGPVFPELDPLTDDDLMDAVLANQKLATRDAAIQKYVKDNAVFSESRLRQWHAEEFIPQAGAILEQGMITLAILRENPALEDTMDELSAIVGKTLAQNPQMGFNKAIDTCTNEALTAMKTSHAIEKMLAKGKLDARTGDAPVGVPRGGVERDPSSGRFTETKPKLSPLAELAYSMANRPRG